MKLPPRRGRVVHSQPETVCSLACGLLEQLDAWSGLGSREAASSGWAGRQFQHSHQSGDAKQVGTGTGKELQV